MDFLKENPQVLLKDPLNNEWTRLKYGLSEVNLPLSNFCISNFYQVSLVLLVHFHLNSLISLQTSFERQMSYNGFLKTVIMLSLKYSHICLSHDYFFFCIIWECFIYEFLPPRMFSHLSFYLNCVQCQGLTSNSLSLLTSANSSVSASQTSLPDLLFSESISNTFVEMNVVFELAFMLVITSFLFFLLPSCHLQALLHISTLLCDAFHI